MKKHLILLVPLLFLMTHCHKNDTPAAHINKFTCKVNGVFWEAVPKERSVLGNDLMAQQDPFGIIFIYASNAVKGEGINFSILPSSNSITIETENPFSASFDLKCGNFRLDTTKNRQVTITFHDKEKKFIKGSFLFSAINKEGRCSNIDVTEGIFDMHYGF